jgi:hypothetical protein
MGGLTVLLAHAGRALELECGPDTRVEEVQAALALLAGAPVEDQILLVASGADAAPLAPGRALGACGLPDGAADVFLYSRALLWPDAPAPGAAEEGAALDEAALAAAEGAGEGDGSGEGEGGSDEEARHPLEDSTSPLLRALPAYSRHFRAHAARLAALAAAGAAALAAGERLLAEAEVVAGGVDAAVASAAPARGALAAAAAAFAARHAARRAAHADVLARFDADLDFLQSIELPEALQRPGRARLADLADIPALRALRDEVATAHRRFGARIGDLEARLAALRADAEALLACAPPADLEALGAAADEARGAAEAQAGAAAAAAADARRAGELLAAAAAGAGGSVGDIVAALEAMHESHGAAAPAARAAGAHVVAFARAAHAARAALTADALPALRAVAAQQERVRAAREALAPFPAALERQDADVAQLLTLRRLPAALRLALAECVRRAAFGDKFSAWAMDLAERMGKFREKEVAARARFLRAVEGVLPGDLLAAAGLAAPPPHCEVSCPGDERSALLRATPGALAHLAPPAAWAAGPAGEEERRRATAEAEADAAAEREGAGTPPEAAATSAPGTASRLEVAHLRAQLAALEARECARAAAAAAAGAPAAAPPAGEPAARFERALAEKDALIAALRCEAEAARRAAAEAEARLAAEALAAPEGGAAPAVGSVVSGDAAASGAASGSHLGGAGASAGDSAPWPAGSGA